MRSTHGWTWVRSDIVDERIGRTGPRWVATLPAMFYPDDSPVVIAAEANDGTWFVGDEGRAMAARRSPPGVIGTLEARLEGFIDVEMSGDCHFFQYVAGKPKASLSRRIEQAAMQVATYSLLMGWIVAPKGWPPQLVITMTEAQAFEHRIL